MTAGHLIGFAMMFALCLVPSTLFVGVLAGRALHLSLRSRYALVVVVAAALAYGIVFHTGTSFDEIQGASPALTPRS